MKVPEHILFTNAAKMGSVSFIPIFHVAERILDWRSCCSARCGEAPVNVWKMKRTFPCLGHSCRVVWCRAINGVASCPKCQPVVFCNPHQRLLGLFKSRPRYSPVLRRGARSLENWLLVSVFRHKAIFIWFNQTFFYILFPENIILRLVQAVTFFLPGLMLFWMCFHA